MAGWFGPGLLEIQKGTIDVDTDTLKLMLVTSGYTFNADHEFVSSANASEIAVTGYTGGFGGSGRKTAVITTQYNTTSNRTEIAIGDLTWTALASGATIAAAILIKEITNDAASRMIAYFDFTGTPTNGGDITLDFTALGSGGNLRITV